MTTRDELLARIEDQGFSPVRFREGYDMEEVDRFLDRLGAEISADRPIAAMVDGARFRPVRLREGYDMQEVDDFLDVVVATVAALTAAEEPPAAVPAGKEGAAPPTADPSSVIQESQGFFRRRFGRLHR